MKKSDRQRRGATEWSVLIERQATSGLSQRNFCDAQGLPLSTFTYWKRKLARGDAKLPSAEAETPLFTPIQALPEGDEPLHSVRTGKESGPGGWMLDLDLGGGLRLTLRRVA